MTTFAGTTTDTDVLGRLAAAVGAEHVSVLKADLDTAATATYETAARPSYIVRPATTEQVRACLAVARSADMPIHPVSSGLNWGFGSRVPPRHGSILLQLSRMKSIELDAQLRTVTLGPGVTQRELFDLIRREGADVMVPISGSLPDSSIVANAAAGGTSNGLHVVRWDHILSLSGTLHGGETVRTGLTRVSDSPRARSARYAVGPDLAGLFRDSDLGVVTELTLELPPLPAVFQVYFFSVADAERMPAVVDTLTRLKDDGLIRGEWFLLHGWRVLAEAMGRYPWNRMRGRTPMPRATMLELLAAARIPSWSGLFNGAFATYLPSRRMARAVKADITEALGPAVDGLRCVELDRAALLRLRDDPDLPIPGLTHEALRARVRTFAGIPKQGYVSIGYWRKPASVATGADLDGDRCGFLWLDFAVPSSGAEALRYSEVIEQTFGAFGFEPMVVIDGVRDRELYLLASLVYDRDLPGEDRRALACFERVTALLAGSGIHPFRLPVGLKHLQPRPLDDSLAVLDRLRGLRP